MRPSQIWLDLSGLDLRVWVNEKLELATAKGSAVQRVGFFREIPLFHLPPASAHPMGWTSFGWEELTGKFLVDADFWPALEAARLRFLNERSESFTAPLSIEFPLANDVLFYGGTFDPWHDGHGACVELAPTHLPLIVCPDRNPHKTLKDKEVVPFLCDLKKKLNAYKKNRTLHLHPGFLLKNEPNPTVNWVLRLKRHRPDLRVHLLIGYDSFKNLVSWTNAQDLVKLLSGVMVVSRLENDAAHESDAAWIKSVNPTIEVKFLGHHPHEAVSSTALRS